MANAQTEIAALYKAAGWRFVSRSKASGHAGLWLCPCGEHTVPRPQGTRGVDPHAKANTIALIRRCEKGVRIMAGGDIQVTPVPPAPTAPTVPSDPTPTFADVILDAAKAIGPVPEPMEEEMEEKAPLYRRAGQVVRFNGLRDELRRVMNANYQPGDTFTTNQIRNHPRIQAHFDRHLGRLSEPVTEAEWAALTRGKVGQSLSQMVRDGGNNIVSVSTRREGKSVWRVTDPTPEPVIQVTPSASEPTLSPTSVPEPEPVALTMGDTLTAVGNLDGFTLVRDETGQLYTVRPAHLR